MCNRFERVFYWCVIAVMCLAVAGMMEKVQYQDFVLNTKQESIQILVKEKIRSSYLLSQNQRD